MSTLANPGGKTAREAATHDLKTAMYRKTAVQPMRPYVPGEDMTRVSVSPADADHGLEVGGMIAWNAANPDDQWYIARDFFEANYELATEPDPRYSPERVALLEHFRECHDMFPLIHHALLLTVIEPRIDDFQDVLGIDEVDALFDFYNITEARSRLAAYDRTHGIGGESNGQS